MIQKNGIFLIGRKQIDKHLLPTFQPGENDIVGMMLRMNEEAACEGNKIAVTVH